MITPRARRVANKAFAILHPFVRMTGWSSERGLSSVPMMVGLGGFAVTAAVLAGSVLDSGLLASDQVTETVSAALKRTTGALELRGSVIAKTNGSEATSLLLDVSNGPGGEAVSLDTGATQNRTVVTFVDDVVAVTVPYSVKWLLGDGDTMLEPGELAQIEVELAFPGHPIEAGDRFSLHVRPPDGAVLRIERAMPIGEPLNAIVELR